MPKIELEKVDYRPDLRDALMAGRPPRAAPPSPHPPIRRLARDDLIGIHQEVAGWLGWIYYFARLDISN